MLFSSFGAPRLLAFASAASACTSAQTAAQHDAGKTDESRFQDSAVREGAAGDAAFTDADAPAAAPSLWLPEPDEEMPEALSAFGLYLQAPNVARISPLAHAYEPRFALWSNGSAKHRAVALPGAVAGDDPPEPGALPLGTYFFKTFTFEDERSGATLPVETRVMRLSQEGWEFHRYTWNESGTDAVLNVSRVQQYRDVRFGEERFAHEIPNELDCKRCHEAADDPVLGYRAFQLGAEPLDAPDEATAAVMGYALGNCVHCHNGLDSDSNSFDLRPDVFLENLIERPTEGSSSGEGIRVVPGEPDESFLFRALQGGDEAAEIQPMPPLGVQLRDQKGIELFRVWIEGLR